MQPITTNKIISTHSFVEISYNESTNVIYAKWKGFLNINQVIQGCEIITSYIIKNKITNHLSDHTELKVLSKEVQEYLTGRWFNDVEKAGLRKIAVKIAEDVFAQATVNNVNTKQQYGKMSIQTFGNINEAYKWLKD